MSERQQLNEEQRRRLLADISHELRTPLTVLQGSLEGLLDGVYQPDAAQLESLLEETRVMSRLIDDLRTLAGAESGTLKLQREPTDLGVLMNEVIASFRGQAQAAGVNLSVEALPDLPLIEIDPARIRQVLVNLIANALRYTGNGGSIRVHCELRNEAVAVTVSDTGRGIAASDLPHIFDRWVLEPDRVLYPRPLGGQFQPRDLSRMCKKRIPGTLRRNDKAKKGHVSRTAGVDGCAVLA